MALKHGLAKRSPPAQKSTLVHRANLTTTSPTSMMIRKSDCFEFWTAVTARITITPLSLQSGQEPFSLTNCDVVPSAAVIWFA